MHVHDHACMCGDILDVTIKPLDRVGQRIALEGCTETHGDVSIVLAVLRN